MRLLILLFLFCLSPILHGEEVRHLMVAKFLLGRLEAVDLTDKQLAAYNQLSVDLRTEVDALRMRVGIDGDVMARRDKAHRELRDLKLEEGVYWSRLQKKAELTSEQLNAFQLTQEKFSQFKAEVDELLTAEQKRKKRNASRKKEELGGESNS